MAKVYAVALAGREYGLAFGARDAITLKKRFEKSVTALLREDVMGMVERQKPGGKRGETHWTLNGTYDLEVQVAFIHLGIVTGGAKGVSEERVIGWVDDHIKAGKSLGELVEPVWRAVLLSGIVGASIDTEAEREGDEPAPEGKE